MNSILGGGLKYVLFSSLFREDSHFDNIFFRWVETTNQNTTGFIFQMLNESMVYLPPNLSPFNYLQF